MPPDFHKEDSKEEDLTSLPMVNWKKFVYVKKLSQHRLANIFIFTDIFWKMFDLTFIGLNESDEGVDSGSGWDTNMNVDVPHDVYLEADNRYRQVYRMSNQAWCPKIMKMQKG